MNIVERIVFLIKQNNITAKRLTSDLELSNSAITDWKKGKGRPSIDAIIKISKYFNVTTDWLLTGEKPNENILVSGEVSGNNNIVGLNHSPSFINNGQKQQLSAEASEILKIYETLDARARNEIFNIVLKFEKEKKEGEKDKK